MLAAAGAGAWPGGPRRFGAALSAGVPAAAKAHWAEGFLSGGSGGSSGPGSPGGGLLLVHDRDLLGVLDAWVTSLGPEEFEEVLPLLRRTFGEFTGPERASIGRAVRSLAHPGATPAAPRVTDDIDAGRAAGAVRTVAAILSGAF
jgi:hypothetical protein